MQDEDYDLSTARHYGAYRPPLHATILALGLRDDERFGHALDVGCGTGSSTHALGQWCHHVIGTDPSTAMIKLAQPAAGVSFRHQPGNNIEAELEENTFDLITFAGSLFYLDTTTVLAGLKRLLAPGGTVVVYDFDVLLQPVFDLLGARMPTSDYDHTKNLSDDTENMLRMEKAVVEVISFELTSAELAHLLYSVSAWRKGPLAEFGFNGLVDQLPVTISLEAKTWLTRYAF